MDRGYFIGLAGVDVVFHVDQYPLEDHKTKTNDYVLKTGGPALNAAKTYALLGGEAVLVSSVGKGVLADYIRADLERFNVRLVDLTPNAQQQNVSSIIIRGSTRTICSGQARRVEAHLPRLEDAIFCHSDGNIFETNDWLIQETKRLGIPLLLDCGSWKEGMDSLLSHAHAAISSEHFLSPDKEDIFSLAKRWNTPFAAMTRGGEPIRTMEGEIEVRKIDHGNTSGAGDVFHGAFAYYFYKCALGFEKSLQKASEIAAKYICGELF